MKLGLFVITNGYPTTKAAIDSVLPYVDEVIVAVDSRTDPAFDATLKVPTYRFQWQDNMSASINEGIDRLAHCDWIIHMDSDEELDGAERLRSVIEAYPEADVIALPRRHYLDLDRKREQANDIWFPDWQYRIRRPHIRMIGRAHPNTISAKHVERTSRLCIDHFNLALKSPEDWARTNALYARLEALEKLD